MQLVKLDIDLPVKGSFAQCPSSNLTHQVAKYNLPQIGKYDFGGGKSSRRFALKLPSTIYPKSASTISGRGGKSSTRFALKSPSMIWTKSSSTIYPPPQIVLADLG